MSCRGSCAAPMFEHFHWRRLILDEAHGSFFHPVGPSFALVLRLCVARNSARRAGHAEGQRPVGWRLQSGAFVFLFHCSACASLVAWPSLPTALSNPSRLPTTRPLSCSAASPRSIAGEPGRVLSCSNLPSFPVIGGKVCVGDAVPLGRVDAARLPALPRGPHRRRQGPSSVLVMPLLGCPPCAARHALIFLPLCC